MTEAAQSLPNPVNVVEEVKTIPKTKNEKKYGSQTGYAGFTITNYGYKKVVAKRKRKGIAEPTPRHYNVFCQWFANTLSFVGAATLVSPLERGRILAQTKHIARPEYTVNISDSSVKNIGNIIKVQGIDGLWRGNNALIYKNVSQMTLKVLFYDKFKQYFMPYDSSKYSVG